MSHDQEQNVDMVTQRLKDKIRRLREQQAAAESMAATIGMTTEDSVQYKKRDTLIKNLTTKLNAIEDHH